MQAARPRLTPEQSLLVLEEVQRRAAFRSINMVDTLFEKQAAFITDTNRLIAVKCTRRAGKTQGMARRLIRKCLQMDGVAVLYIGLTRDSCKRIFWDDAFKPLVRKMKLPGKPNEVSLTWTFPNYSRIYCLGMDATKDQMEKALGGKYAEIDIDEAGSFRVNLRRLVYEILKPSTADYLGPIVIGGTPQALTRGLFYEATQTKDRSKRKEKCPDWTVHEWTTYDNPYMIKQWESEIEEMVRLNPLIKQTPMFKRMYEGEWWLDDERRIYKYDREKNWIPELPGSPSDYIYGLGVDLGFEDDSAFVLTAYNQHSPRLYFLKPYRSAGMIFSDVAEKIEWYRRNFEIYSIVIDGANKQGVEEMRRRFGLPLIAAEKQGKLEFIELFNADLIQKNIMLVGEECAILEEEWANLIWEEKDEKNPYNPRKEHPQSPNHLSDAALYIWRKQYQYLYQPLTEKPKKSAEDEVDEFFEKQAARVMQADNEEFWERDY